MSTMAATSDILTTNTGTKSSGRCVVLFLQTWRIDIFHEDPNSGAVMESYGINESCKRCMILCKDRTLHWDPIRIIRGVIDKIGISKSNPTASCVDLFSWESKTVLHDLPPAGPGWDEDFHDMQVEDLGPGGLSSTLWVQIPPSIRLLLLENLQEPSQTPRRLSSDWKYTQTLSMVPLPRATTRYYGVTLRHDDELARTDFPPRTASYSYSPASFFTSSPASFFSSPSSFMTARSTYNSPAYVLSTTSKDVAMFDIIEEETPLPRALEKLKLDYQIGLEDKRLVQAIEKELDWSGKGQHVVFLPSEAPPLITAGHLGASLTARVDKVFCRRIALARKTMKCTRAFTIADALQEVKHLQDLQHHHIVQLVGTYLQGRNFALLMYPAAECHLGQFLQETADEPSQPWSLSSIGNRRRVFLAGAMSCIASAISYVHDHTTKHMDIKPQNILVRDDSLWDRNTGKIALYRWKIYLADFGLSRSFADQGHSQTDGPVARTPRYCAPEVYAFEARGRAADMFSVGCVYLEMLTVYCRRDLEELCEHFGGAEADGCYHANPDKISSWLERLQHQLHLQATVKTLVADMLQLEPARRPRASDVLDFFFSPDLDYEFRGRLSCCTRRPEPYVYSYPDPDPLS